MKLKFNFNEYLLFQQRPMEKLSTNPSCSTETVKKKNCLILVPAEVDF